MVEFSRGGVQRLDCVDTAAWQNSIDFAVRYQFNPSYQSNVCAESCETGPKECEPLRKNPQNAFEILFQLRSSYNTTLVLFI